MVDPNPKCVWLDRVIRNLSFFRAAIHADIESLPTDPGSPSNNNVDDIILSISEDLTDLVISNSVGEVDQECIRRRAALISKILQTFSQFDSANDLGEILVDKSKQEITDNINELMKELLLDC